MVIPLTKEFWTVVFGLWGRMQEARYQTKRRKEQRERMRRRAQERERRPEADKKI